MDDFDERISLIAYKDFKDLTQEELALCKIENELCKVDFFRFLKWIKIIQPPVIGQTGGGILPFEVYPHIHEIMSYLLTCPLIVILKARQIGLSTLMATYHLWMVRSKIGANLLLFSKGQPEAKELLSKSHRIYNLLPPFMKYHIDPDSTEELGFPVMNSAIKAFPSTQSAGISYTASLVTCDEHAAHPYADANYMSSKPTRDQGGQFVSVFTADPYSNDNLATSLFVDALEGKNDFIPLFFPWNVIPNRDEEWYERTKRNIPERELAQLSPDLYMAKNYPHSIEEALSLSSTVAVFDKKVLNSLMDRVRSPINSGEFWDLDNTICYIYKDYSPNNLYIAASDVSLGVGGDYGTLCIMDAKTGEVVADIMSKEIKPEELAYHSISLLKRFRNPRWWIEHNLYGRTVIRTAIDLGYRNFGYKGDKPIHWSTIDDTEIKRVGFWTDEKSRADLFGSLISAINTFQITIYNGDGLKQFYSMIRNVSKGGKIEASSGKHDDYVITVGLCWLKRSDVHGIGSMEPVRSLHMKNDSTILDRVRELESARKESMV